MMTKKDKTWIQQSIFLSIFELESQIHSSHSFANEKLVIYHFVKNLMLLFLHLLESELELNHGSFFGGSFIFFFFFLLCSIPTGFVLARRLQTVETSPKCAPCGENLFWKVPMKGSHTYPAPSVAMIAQRKLRVRMQSWKVRRQCAMFTNCFPKVAFLAPKVPLNRIFGFLAALPYFRKLSVTLQKFRKILNQWILKLRIEILLKKV